LFISHINHNIYMLCYVNFILSFLTYSFSKIHIKHLKHYLNTIKMRAQINKIWYIIVSFSKRVHIIKSTVKMWGQIRQMYHSKIIEYHRANHRERIHSNKKLSERMSTLPMFSSVSCIPCAKTFTNVFAQPCKNLWAIIC